MIDTIKDVYCFLEAQIVRSAKTENRFPFLVLQSLFYPLFFNLVFFLPCFFTARGKAAAVIIWIIFSLCIFTLILIRMIRLFVQNGVLDKIIESNRNAFDSFLQSLSGNIGFNLIFYSSAFGIALVYFSLVYGICSFFIAGSFVHYLSALLVLAFLSAVCLFFAFFHFYIRGKDMFWPKILLPVSVTVLAFTALSLIGIAVRLDRLTFYICSFAPGWWCILPAARQLLKDEDRAVNITFRSAVFLHALCVIVFLFSYIDISLFARIPFTGNLFIAPVISAITGILISIKSAVAANHFFFYLMPHLFVPLLLFLRILHDTASRIKHLRIKTLFDEKIFGKPLFSSGLSMFPVMGRAAGFTVISMVLLLEIKPLANMLFSLVDSFRIVQVFHLSFLTADNITFVLQLLFSAVVVVFVLRLADSLVSRVFSMVILFADELVYIDQRILKRFSVRVPLARIHAAGLHQHTIGRLFDIGTILTESPGQNRPVSVAHVPGAGELYRMLLENIKRAA